TIPFHLDKEVKKEVEEEENGKKNKERKEKYAGIPQHLLNCFVCSKNMWNGESFQKHVRGRAYKLMLDSLEESMGITVNMLRENMRLAEEEKMIGLNRMHRLNKNHAESTMISRAIARCGTLNFLGKSWPTERAKDISI
ncbi:hypothetical protein HHI36_009334, partial [Cryptolaemus montrouzieri]